MIDYIITGIIDKLNNNNDKKKENFGSSSSSLTRSISSFFASLLAVYLSLDASLIYHGGFAIDRIKLIDIQGVLWAIFAFILSYVYLFFYITVILWNTKLKKEIKRLRDVCIQTGVSFMSGGTPLPNTTVNV